LSAEEAATERLGKALSVDWGRPHRAGAAPMIRSDFITTAFTFQRYRVVREIGIAHGIVVRSRSIVGNFLGSIQTIFGGNISIYTELCEQARRQAFEKMMKDANGLGANAIIGFRFESTDIGPGLTEVLAYGTAVEVEPV
jgi:uncharacterized protein YbjQ (UPF0145 family)